MTTDPFLYIDLETRSACDLKKAGSHKYFEDPTTDVIVASYAIGDGSVHTVRGGMTCPDDLREHIEAGKPVSGWNVGGFEKIAFDRILGPRYGWPVPALEQYDDTAAAAAAMSLPRALGQAAAALGTDAQKDDEGYRLMLRMSRPRKARKGEDPKGIYWWDDEERMARLALYCEMDVETERAIRKMLVPLSPDEMAVWRFDLTMNTRGVRIDVPLAQALQRIVEQAKAKLDKEIAAATNYEITACSQVAALTAWISAEMCMKVESLDKASIETLLAMDDLPDHVRRVVEIRREAAKTSTAKLEAMLKCAGEGDRARGLHLYHGASTGRWSGRLLQPQNFSRGGALVEDPEAAAPTMLHGNADLVEMIYGAPMTAVSDMLRSCLVASPDHRLIAADYSSIEGRVTAWVAGEQWKLDAFVASDEGRGAGMYEVTAGSIFNADPFSIGKKDPRRQVGKTAELALGFAGGVSAFHAFAVVYNVDMETAYEPLRETTSQETWEKALESFDRWAPEGKLATDRMSKKAWIASEVTKVRWREEHPATVRAWAGLQEAIFDAVARPGTVASYGCIRYIVRRGMLWCQLPSGRCLAYGAPKIEPRKTPWGDEKEAVTAMGVDSVTRKWRRFTLSPQISIENVVQAIARDLMAHGMLKAEAAGYPIVLTIHDEAVADTPQGHGSVADFERLLCDLPAWAKGLPVVAEGFEAQRYRK